MRIHLKGVGVPHPEQALPDLGIASDLPPRVLNLPNGTPFLPADYIDMGYTNYEVTCIGAAGGPGGNYIDVGASSDHYDQPLESYGGGGGGGGMQRVSGLLSALPSSCPVVVGVAGVKGANGSGTEFDPGSYVPTQPGTNGGASSFNGITCRASGGKGGLATPVLLMREQNPPRDTRPGGSGGQGGIGGQTTVGGGAAGSVATPVYGDPPFDAVVVGWTLIGPEDGVWDGAIGKGGGGGQGGTFIGQLDPRFPSGGSNAYLSLASAGGQGSFSYADTSVYGPRQNRSGGSFTPDPVIAGSGGGAKVTQLSMYGSRSPGASPNGVVYIRLTKIV